MYCITLLATGKVYVGTSCNPQARFRQHCRRPPRRMRPDLDPAQPAAQQLALALQQQHRTQAGARRHERRLILQLGANGPNGYNNLPGTPGSSPAFWARLHARRRAAARLLQQD